MMPPCLQVRKVIGPFATPDYVILTAALPKTRSGKIMRRVLRKIIAQQTDQLGKWWKRQTVIEVWEASCSRC